MMANFTAVGTTDSPARKQDLVRWYLSRPTPWRAEEGLDLGGEGLGAVCGRRQYVKCDPEQLLATEDRYSLALCGDEYSALRRLSLEPQATTVRHLTL